MMMKKLYYLLFLPFVLIGCQNNQSALPTPSNISNVSAKPDTGAAIVYLDIPTDGNLLYVKVSTKKYPNSPDSNQVIASKASKYADSVVVKGLLNKYQYEFKVQPFTANADDKKGGEVLKTGPVRPIPRPVKTIYYPRKLTPVTVDPAEVSAKTHDYIPNLADYLFDEDVNTFWQSAWYYHPHTAPFYIYFSYDKEVTIGAMKYTFRQNGDTRGSPDKWRLSISENGETWKPVWTSEGGLSVVTSAAKVGVNFDKNYTSKHFRLTVLSTYQEGATFCQFSGLFLYKMKEKSVDLEKQAEKNYDDHFYQNF